MNALARRDGVLTVEDVPLTDVAALCGTPTYVYSRASIERAYRAFDEALAEKPHLVCYAVKANSNLGVLNVLARLGAGFDIVSGGELARVLAAGGDPRKTVFSGVGKTDAEIEAALAADILCFNVESAGELERIDDIARRAAKRARVSLRVNPDVDPRTHAYISTGLKTSKFGIAYADARALYARAASMANVSVTGIDMHIGSQITDLAPYREATRRVVALYDALADDGIALQHIDLGGGLGVAYREEPVISPEEYARVVRDAIGARPATLLFEPGRLLVGSAGVLLTRVVQTKRSDERNFAVVDAAMNDLLRPALYDAWHDVAPVSTTSAGERLVWQIVGPVCESADFLAHDRDLALCEGDLLAIATAGAYGMTMSSNYNSRPRACEAIVDGASLHVVRARETIAELFANETTLP